MRKDRAFRNETVWATLKKMAETVAPTLAELARESGYSEPSVLRALDDLIEEGQAWHYDWRKVHGRYLRSYKPGEMPKGFKLQVTPPKGRSKNERNAAYKARKTAAKRTERQAARVAREAAEKAAKEAAKRPRKTPEQLKARELATERATYARNRQKVRAKRKAYYEANREELNRKRRQREADKRAEQATKDAAFGNVFLQLSKPK